jgi:hypothetical protein
MRVCAWAWRVWDRKGEERSYSAVDIILGCALDSEIERTDLRMRSGDRLSSLDVRTKAIRGEIDGLGYNPPALM